MVSSRKYNRCGFGAALFIVNIFFSLLSLHYISGAHNDQQKRRELVLGSEPPLCASKCLNCKPCIPYLFDIHGNDDDDDDDDDSEPYYPVRWMCRCRHRVFEP
ncbi:EPIDERMAL PATTERNING FACTOR-like protein 8 [Cardamine amara subsp. amara]|uniref:Epidermal patterning factor-like protein n=1 Tax=Cardamine amara subsp. amara TaxID=228776 RepID=A0ABD0ZXK5_CARAN